MTPNLNPPVNSGGTPEPEEGGCDICNDPTCYRNLPEELPIMPGPAHPENLPGDYTDCATCGHPVEVGCYCNICAANAADEFPDDSQSNYGAW